MQERKSAHRCRFDLREECLEDCDYFQESFRWIMKNSHNEGLLPEDFIKKFDEMSDEEYTRLCRSTLDHPKLARARKKCKRFSESQ